MADVLICDMFDIGTPPPSPKLDVTKSGDRLSTIGQGCDHRDADDQPAPRHANDNHYWPLEFWGSNYIGPNLTDSPTPLQETSTLCQPLSWDGSRGFWSNPTMSYPEKLPWLLVTPRYGPHRPNQTLAMELSTLWRLNQFRTKHIISFCTHEALKPQISIAVFTAKEENILNRAPCSSSKELRLGLLCPIRPQSHTSTAFVVHSAPTQDDCHLNAKRYKFKKFAQPG